MPSLAPSPASLASTEHNEEPAVIVQKSEQSAGRDEPVGLYDLGRAVVHIHHAHLQRVLGKHADNLGAVPHVVLRVSATAQHSYSQIKRGALQPRYQALFSPGPREMKEPGNEIGCLTGTCVYCVIMLILGQHLSHWNVDYHFESYRRTTCGMPAVMLTFIYPDNNARLI